MKKIGTFALVLAALGGAVAALRRWHVLDRVRGRESLTPGYAVHWADDATLKSRVESEIFRGAETPKGHVNVNVQAGVIQLRGEVESQGLIEDLVARARAVDGVVGVESLLHVPGAEAPMHQ